MPNDDCFTEPPSPPASHDAGARRLRMAARPGAGWEADADPGAGFLLVARGCGGGTALAASLGATVRAALASAEPIAAAGESATQTAVRTVVAFLRGAHQELRHDAIPGGPSGLEVLVAIAGQDRLHVIAVGGVACLRRRRREVELVAPLSRRARPPLGESPRAVIEVTNESLAPGDVVIAVPGGHELEAETALAAEAGAIVDRVQAWPAGGLGLAPTAWASPCAVLHVPPVAAAGDLEARVEIRGPAPGLALEPAPELPAWLAGPGSAPAPRRDRYGLTTRGVGLLVAAAGAFLFVLAVGRMAEERGPAGNEERPPLVHARAPLSAGATVASPAAVLGVISARTVPPVPGARVFLDGREVGPAPVTLEGVAPGRHRVRFSGPDDFAWEEEVMVRPGETTEAVAPLGDVEDVALVTVQTSAMSDRGAVFKHGLPLLLDGVERGETPLDIALEPGVHMITIRRASGPPIHRALEVRRGDRFTLDIPIDRQPAVTIEHRPPATLKAGEAPILTAVRRGLDARSNQPVHLHVAAGDRWSEVAMAPIPGAPGTYAVGLPLTADPGTAIRYFFTTTSDGGEKVSSELFQARLR